MKTSGVVSIACAALVLMAAACAEAQRAENVNYRSPVIELPALAKSGASWIALCWALPHCIAAV